MKKRILIVFAFFIALCGAIFFINSQKNEIHLAIIPHFMLDTNKVDEFYFLLHDKRYDSKLPDNIVLISPNHFFPENKNISTVCQDSDTWFQSDKVHLIKMKNTLCESNVFKEIGIISEHGLGAHFRWISKYFSGVDIIPLVYPSHDIDSAEKFAKHILKLKGNILVIASVDFAHYLPEDITYEHDMDSIALLQNGTGTKLDFFELDVDCPACLYTITELSKKTNQKAKFRYRDSSSTIFGKDMGEDNTSRVFMYYE